MNIGYFPNLTHAPGLVADADGTFADRFGKLNVKVSTKSFNAGPDVIQAILSGSLDISYIGPNPTVTAYIQSHSDGIRVIAGSTSGGASLVVKPEITGAEQLRGKKLATPQLGNTQDIALRSWLKDQGLTADQGRRRRRVDPAAAELRGRPGLHRRLDRRRLGARAVRHPPGEGRRQGAGGREDACGRTASSSPPT